MKVAGKYIDAELIAALNDKQELDKAIMYIYQQYSETVSSFITNNGGSRQDSDDIFQETVIAFVSIAQQGKYRGEASIKTFLVSIAKNIWYNELRKRSSSGRREKLYESNRGTEETDVSHYISDREIKKELRELLGKLDEPCRKILTLFYYENLPMKEIVKHLHYENEQVVRNKKYKCLQHLTGLIKDNPLMAGTGKK